MINLILVAFYSKVVCVCGGVEWAAHHVALLSSSPSQLALQAFIPMPSFIVIPDYYRIGCWFPCSALGTCGSFILLCHPLGLHWGSPLELSVSWLVVEAGKGECAVLRML